MFPSRKQYTRILESDTMARAHHFISRHSKNRILSLLLCFFLAIVFIFLLSPSSSTGFHDALGDLLSWGSENQRPNYEGISKSKRAEAVREAFLYAYGAYEKYAMPADELLPLKNRNIQK